MPPPNTPVEVVETLTTRTTLIGILRKFFWWRTHNEGLSKFLEHLRDLRDEWRQQRNDMNARLSAVNRLLNPIAKAQYTEEMLTALKRRPLPRKSVRQDLYEVIASLLLRNPTKVRQAEGTKESGGILRRLPNELILQVVEYIPPQAQACLALTNTIYFQLMGAECWQKMAEPAHQAKRLQFLCQIEEQGDAPKLLVCSHHVAFHAVPRFDVEDQAKEPRSRVCTIKFGEVEICNHIRVTRSEMQAIPDDTLLVHLSNVQPLPFDEDKRNDEIPDRLSSNKSQVVVIEIMKINSVVYVKTMYTFEDLPDDPDRDFFSSYISGTGFALCPHFRWNGYAFWRWSCYGVHVGDEKHCSVCEHPAMCAFCKTEFTQGFKTLKDGRKHYYIKMWRELGSDADPMSTNWTNQCHMGRYKWRDFRPFGEPLRKCDNGMPIRKVMNINKASVIQSKRAFEFKVLSRTISQLTTAVGYLDLEKLESKLQ